MATPHISTDNFKLAVLRTELANRRTLLAFFKTGIGLLVSAVGFLKFLNKGPMYEWVGIALIPAALLVLGWGLLDYFHSRKRIREEQQAVFSASSR